jgi:hypothetical protein
MSYSDILVSSQAFSASNPSIETETNSSSINLIDEWARSERGDHRVIAADLRIEQECAELDRETSAEPSVKEAYTADPADISAKCHADTSSWYRTPPSGGPSLARCRARAARLKAKRMAAIPRAKPVRQGRVARARAVHSHAAHGGARKAADDGSGSDGPPPPHPRSSRRQVSGAGL